MKEWLLPIVNFAVGIGAQFVHNLGTMTKLAGFVLIVLQIIYLIRQNRRKQ